MAVAIRVSGERSKTVGQRTEVGACGKIVILITSAFATVYFKFSFRQLAFWAIFVMLMLPAEVRIVPTFKVVAELGLRNSYAGLTVPLIASATATFLFRRCS